MEVSAFVLPTADQLLFRYYWLDSYLIARDSHPIPRMNKYQNIIGEAITLFILDASLEYWEIEIGK